jgi:membrane-associated protease RseP (regulator of RpoE activity)
MDMVGRLNDSTRNLLVYGIGTSTDYGTIFSSVNHTFNLVFDSSGIGPSDHTSFYLKNIPVLHFFTGQHTDYHKPSDDADKINFSGTHEVITFIKDLAKKIAAYTKINFTETKANEQEKVSFKVTLGIMPDYAFQDKGVKIDAVTNGKPAQVAGIKAGDIIIAINSEPLKDVYEYMKQLAKFSKGDEANVMVQRKTETLTFKVKF